MEKSLSTMLLGISLFLSMPGLAQVDEERLGAWYMYYYSVSFAESPWGVQGDFQYRNWDRGGDLEQLLLRSGLTFKAKGSVVKFTLGYANVTTGIYGSDNSITRENRIYQEALFPFQFGSRFYTNHRFRSEQRFSEHLDFKTRYRYNLFLDISLNKAEMDKNTIYLALYNEVFINGLKNVRSGNGSELFDRNRFYAALGYLAGKGTKIQFGIMNQITRSWRKNQLQLSLHQNI